MIIEFLGDLLSKVEFWSVTTLGMGVSTILATMWNMRSNTALKKSNINGAELHKEIKEMKTAEVNSTREIQSLKEENTQLKSQVMLMNDNLFILTQSANIGVENKEAIKKNYLSMNSSLPVVAEVAEPVKTVVTDIADEIKEIKKQSKLDELIKKL